jgi:hypothetical protein
LTIEAKQGQYPFAIFDTFGWEAASYVPLLAKFLRTRLLDKGTRDPARDKKVQELTSSATSSSSAISFATSSATSSDQPPSSDNAFPVLPSIAFAAGMDPGQYNPHDGKHAVILTVRAIDVANKPQLKLLHEQYNAINQVAGLPVLLAITHFDVEGIVEKAAEDPYAILSSPMIGVVMGKIHAGTGIPIDAMRVILPYHLGSFNHPVKDYLVFKLVVDILEMARSSIETRAAELDAVNFVVPDDDPDLEQKLQKLYSDFKDLGLNKSGGH